MKKPECCDEQPPNRELSNEGLRKRNYFGVRLNGRDQPEIGECASLKRSRSCRGCMHGGVPGPGEV